jgi:hypothetical protein
MATAIQSGAKNSSAAAAAVVSNSRFPIELEGSAWLDMARRRTWRPKRPMASNGRTDIGRRRDQRGIELS